MEKETRNAIERATQRARRLLEEDYAAQLEGEYDILPSGKILEGAHLKPREAFRRDRIVSVIEHKRAAGMEDAESVADYIRDAAFTTLNRFVALKMLEARGLVQECITQGEQSSGYKEYTGLAPGLAAIPDGSGYRLYIESLFDELSTEIKVLFDRRDAASILWPRRQTFEDLLATLNVQELAAVWGEDETIGWVYQYFNSGDERRTMRAESQAPRNSRELAVRNQFFTPRYVVQFLTDNTLGRTWFEMMDEKTRLAEACEYLVRTDEPTQARDKKDPRDLRILDPACGSGHFLLYTFDLLLHIYEEAWEHNASIKSQLTDKSLRDEYPDLNALRKAAPALIVEHNLYGVDIDPRCAQIAALALWLRAQRAWKDANVPSGERPRIRRTHIVVAEPMPGDKKLVDEFANQLQPPILGDLFRKMVQETRLAGDMGVLLRLEKSLEGEITRARTQFAQERGRLTKLVGIAPARRQGELDLSGIDDTQFFHDAEARILRELQAYAETATATTSTRRRLFAGDAAQGVALIDLVRTRFDVILMNPPFGMFSEGSESFARQSWGSVANDIYAVFALRAISMLEVDGCIGAITSRSWVKGRDLREFRPKILTGPGRLSIFADLGLGILDKAEVETGAFVIRRSTTVEHGLFADLKAIPRDDLDTSLIRRNSWIRRRLAEFTSLPECAILYEATREEMADLSSGSSLDPDLARVTRGLNSSDNFRFMRLHWEVPAASIGTRYKYCAKGGEYQWILPNIVTVIDWERDGALIEAAVGMTSENVAQARRSSDYYFRSGLTYTRRCNDFSLRALPKGCIFLDSAPVIIPHESQDAKGILGAFLGDRYARLLRLVHKKGMYDTGRLGKLPPPPKATTAVIERFASVMAILSPLERQVESSPYFTGLTVQGPSRAFSEDRLVSALTALVAAVGLEPSTEFILRSVQAFSARYAAVSSANSILSYAMWLVFARNASDTEGSAIDPFAPFPSRKSEDPHHPAWIEHDARPEVGSPLELELMARLAGLLNSEEEVTRVISESCGKGGIAQHFSAPGGFFNAHLGSYSAAFRKAPVYWQLSTPSGLFSVWLRAHRVDGDTLFQIQSDVLSHRLLGEERRLEAIRRSPEAQSPKGQRSLREQETFVSELKWFVEEVQRLAPLWNPQLEDGIVLAKAPLWRLVQHKAWQKELQQKWDELSDGKYDWSHQAMHLWPERVVPKCAEDRSLAIAHGLEDVFWVEDEDGKWSKRAKPTRSIEELVKERTSPAVKAALKSLLEAPPPAGSSARGRKSKKSGGSE